MSTETTIAVEAISSTANQRPPRVVPPERIPNTEMETDSEDVADDPNAAVFIVQPDWYLSLRYSMNYCYTLLTLASPPVSILADTYVIDFREDSGKSWITFKQRGHLGVHAKIISEGESKDGQTYNISCDDEEFHLSEISNKSFCISHSKAKDLVFKIIRPEVEFSSIHSKNVS